MKEKVKLYLATPVHSDVSIHYTAICSKATN